MISMVALDIASIGQHGARPKKIVSQDTPYHYAVVHQRRVSQTNSVEPEAISLMVQLVNWHAYLVLAKLE